MIRFALIAASVLGFALTAALGNLMVPLLRELQLQDKINTPFYLMSKEERQNGSSPAR